MPAVISAFLRSPFTPAHKGQLAKVRPDELAAQVIGALVAKSKVNPADIEDLLLGCAFPEGEQGLNIARLVALMAGLPISVAGATINRFCGSSMEAVHIAAGKIAAGAGEVFVCAGVESMTRIPIGGYNPLPHPGFYQKMPSAYMSMGMTAEAVAASCNIDRKSQESFALESHRRAVAADLSDEIVPIKTKDGEVTLDGCKREGGTAEALAALEPAFKKGGTVTAATSSPLTDGAAALLVVSEDYADKHGLPKLARIKSIAVAGRDPETMGLGPVDSTKKALERAGIAIGDIDVAEINEAFAAQALPCMTQIGIDPSKVNIEGGAIALGHPLGASGARIVGKAAKLLHRDGGKYALATMCIGGGQGIATVLEKI